LDKLKQIWNRYRDVLLYLIFGGLTTLVNYLIYFPLHRYCAFSATISNVFAWIGAVIFAFLTNKPFVFESHDWSKEVVLPELGKFVGSRLFSGLLETGFIALTVDLLKWHSLAMKVISSIAVIVMNYVASRWLIFKKK
jgi:putative flippase GtrA